jgi:hypothetical protein
MSLLAAVVAGIVYDWVLLLIRDLVHQANIYHTAGDPRDILVMNLVTSVDWLAHMLPTWL